LVKMPRAPVLRRGRGLLKIIGKSLLYEIK
jgi:hypothetical protein